MVSTYSLPKIYKKDIIAIFFEIETSVCFSWNKRERQVLDTDRGTEFVSIFFFFFYAPLTFAILSLWLLLPEKSRERRTRLVDREVKVSKVCLWMSSRGETFTIMASIVPLITTSENSRWINRCLSSRAFIRFGALEIPSPHRDRGAVTGRPRIIPRKCTINFSRFFASPLVHTRLFVPPKYTLAQNARLRPARFPMHSFTPFPSITAFSSSLSFFTITFFRTS